jgi:hypothetical protein
MVFAEPKSWSSILTHEIRIDGFTYLSATGAKQKTEDQLRNRPMQALVQNRSFPKTGLGQNGTAFKRSNKRRLKKLRLQVAAAVGTVPS